MILKLHPRSFLKIILVLTCFAVWIVLFGISNYFYLQRTNFPHGTTENSTKVTTSPPKSSVLQLFEIKILPTEINVTKACAENPPYLLIIIKSGIDYFESREAVRNTWAQLDPYGLIQRVFLVGQPDRELNSTMEKKLKQEMHTYKDMVQGNFMDTYLNLTLKTIMGLKWANENCLSADFILFADDDTYVHPRLLLKYLRDNVTQELYEKLYAGYLSYNLYPQRDPDWVWYVSYEEYPNEFYPPYVGGSFYLFSSQSIRVFYDATKTTKFLKFEDVFLGIIARERNIDPIHIESVYHAWVPFDVEWFPTVMSAHKLYPEELLEIWRVYGDELIIDKAFYNELVLE